MAKSDIPEIGKPSDVCLQCGKQLEEFDKHPSALQTSSEEIVRRDFCPVCWKDIKKQDFYIYWMTKRIQKTAEDKKMSRKDKGEILLRFFTMLRNREKDEYKPHLFILAHLLMKYGVFKFLRNVVDSDGASEIVFECDRLDEEIVIEEIDHVDERLVEVRKETERHLTENLPSDNSQ